MHLAFGHSQDVSTALAKRIIFDTKMFYSLVFGMRALLRPLHQCDCDLAQGALLCEKCITFDEVLQGR